MNETNGWPPTGTGAGAGAGAGMGAGGTGTGMGAGAAPVRCMVATARAAPTTFAGSAAAPSTGVPVEPGSSASSVMASQASSRVPGDAQLAMVKAPLAGVVDVPVGFAPQITPPHVR